MADPVLSDAGAAWAPGPRLAANDTESVGASIQSRPLGDGRNLRLHGNGLHALMRVSIPHALTIRQHSNCGRRRASSPAVTPRRAGWRAKVGTVTERPATAGHREERGPPALNGQAAAADGAGWLRRQAVTEDARHFKDGDKPPSGGR